MGAAKGPEANVVGKKMPADYEKVTLTDPSAADAEDGQQQAGPEHEQVTCSVILLASVASVGGFLFGYDTGVVSGAMIEIKRSGSGLSDQTMSDQLQEAIVSSTVAAAAVGGCLSGLVQRTRYCGRKGLVIQASVLFTIAAVLMAVSRSVLQILVGRVLVGLSVGVASHTVPLYIAEAAPPSLRGTLAVANSVMIVLGQVIASAACCYYARADYENQAGGVQGWRWMLGWGAAPSAALLLGVLVLPESPRWLLHVAEDEVKARRALFWLRGSEESAMAELKSIRASIEADAAAEQGPKGSLLHQLFCTRRTRRALVLGIGLQLLQQATGINTIMYYSATIVEMARSAGEHEDSCRSPADDTVNSTAIGTGGLEWGSVSDVCWTAPIALSQLIGTLISMCLVDRLGRRALTLTSLFFAGVCLAALGFAFHGHGDSAMAIAAMCAYLIFFGIGLGPMPWVVNAEIYPLETRGAAIGLTTATNWVSNFFVAATYLDLAKGLSTDRACPGLHPDGVFWLYAVIAMVGYTWLAFTMPETRGVSLEELDKLFQ